MTADPVALANTVREALRDAQLRTRAPNEVAIAKLHEARANLDALVSLCERLQQERDEAREKADCGGVNCGKCQQCLTVHEYFLKDSVTHLKEELARERVARETAERERDDWRDIARMRTAEVAVAEAAVCAAQERAEKTEGLLRRLREWDALNPSPDPVPAPFGDLPYWIAEIDRALASVGVGARKEPEPRCSMCGRPTSECVAEHRARKEEQE